MDNRADFERARDIGRVLRKNGMDISHKSSSEHVYRLKFLFISMYRLNMVEFTETTEVHDLLSKICQYFSLVRKSVKPSRKKRNK